MKNIQTDVLKILLLFAVTFSGSSVEAQVFTRQFAYADSLFKVKQYTQSLKIYEEVLAARQYSPSMLLKMAYIHEGLGNVSQGLYYLNLYFQATGDHQTLLKMQELAVKNRLEGYENPESDQFYYQLNKYDYLISLVLAAAALLSLAWMYSQKRKNIKSIGSVVMMMIFLVLLAVQVNFPFKNSEIMITSGTTYLMSGPSAGAEVIAVVEAGHKLRKTNKKDVWLEVQWFDKPVYVKQNRVSPITL
jgi:tetratricopeptide (TPR) repeat protein